MNPLTDQIMSAGQGQGVGPQPVESPGQMAPTTRPKNRFIDRVLMRQTKNEQMKAMAEADPSMIMQLLSGGGQ
jgi:hypothetical protein